MTGIVKYIGDRYRSVIIFGVEVVVRKMYQYHCAY
jgi:hypothetical protein